MRTVTFTFRADVPDDLDPHDIEMFELADLILKREIHPRVDLPSVAVDDRTERSRKLAARKVGVDR